MTHPTSLTQLKAPVHRCCGGRLRLIALIEQAAVIERILQHLGLPTDVPVPRPSRAPPLFEGDRDNQRDGVDRCAEP